MLSKLDVSANIYKDIMAIQVYNGTRTSENITGSRKTLMVDSRKLASLKPNSDLNLGALPSNKFAPFLARFTKNLYQSFKTNPELFTKKIPLIQSNTIGANHLIWLNIPNGTYFYNIDFKSAYWQFAHKLGYINDKLYHRYMHDDNYKEAKRYCISFLARPNYTHYYGPGGEITNTIECDTTILKQAFENIRNSMYKLIQDAVGTTDKWISYNQDSVSVEFNETGKVMHVFHEAGIEFKKNLCQKINNSEYKHGYKTKIFK